MHESVMNFGKKWLRKELIEGKSVLEVGSRDINGSLRGHVESLRPGRFLGVDAEEGKGVDKVVLAENLVETFGEESFDVVYSTEMLEHTNDWQEVVNNIKRVCKVGGHVLITARGPGFGYHPTPPFGDNWRFTVEDFRKIFEDFEVLELVEDHQAPGVMFFGKRVRKQLTPLEAIFVKRFEVVDIGMMFFNRKEYSEIALKTMWETEFEGKLRWILIDNGSVDGTRELLIKWKEDHPEDDIRLILNEKNLGGNAAKNQIIGNVKTRFFARCDNDYIYSRDWLKVLYQTMIRFPKVGSLSAWPQPPFPDQPREKFIFKDGYGYFPDKRANGVMLLRREAVDATGPIDDKPSMYEQDFWLQRMRRKGWDFGWCWGCFVKHLDQTEFSLKETKYKGYFEAIRSGKWPQGEEWRKV